MLKKILAFILLSFVSVSAIAAQAESAKVKHVIYITLDGARWQDVMRDKTYFPKLWRYADGLEIYGAQGSNRTIEVASIAKSLPSYQSQMTGAVQPCMTNQCGRVLVQTLPENLLAKLKLEKKDVAVFSSWKEIADASESKKDTVYVNVANQSVVDPVTGKPDSYMQKINHLQTINAHIEKNRLDEYTFKQAMHYFEKYKPVFLWIALVNADNEAHMGHLNKYHQVLASYDDNIDEVFTTLKQMNLDKDTMVIITTDHGRGRGEGWTTHGAMYPEAKQTWAFVKNGQLQSIADDGKRFHYSTLSIRPTIEKTLGVI